MNANVVQGGLGLLVSIGMASVAQAGPSEPRVVAQRFHEAFSGLRPADLVQYYAANLKFQDAVFKYDDRAGTMGMWKQILGAKPSPNIRYAMSSVAGDTVVGHWVADYVIFGHPVHNEITSTLTIRNGQIVRHVDAFPFAIWAAQAFGLKGTRLEWLASNAQFQKAVIAAFRLAIKVTSAQMPKLPTLCEVISMAGWAATLVHPLCAGH